MSTSTLLVGAVFFGQLTQCLIQFVHGSRCSYMKWCWGMFECDREVMTKEERDEMIEEGRPRAHSLAGADGEQF